jgi:UDP-2,3-diacylglucosamine pyrophosphatase LpxH
VKYLTCEIPQDHGYLIPIGDVHFSDQNFNKEGQAKLKGYLDWVTERDNAKIFLMGDIFNVAGRNEKTSPFEQKQYEEDINEYTKATDFFKPYSSKIIGAIEGNHEERIYDEYGISPLQMFCRELTIPYCKYSAIVRFMVGKRRDSNRFKQNYFVFFHHTIGGGSTVGSKLNRVAKLRDIVEGVDVMCGGHNHQLAVAPQEVYYPSIQGGIRKRRIWFVDCGSYVDYNNSYAEQKQLSPTKLGSPRIRLAGKEEHDIHVSL